MSLPRSLERLLALVRVDFPPSRRLPRPGPFVVACVVALAGSLLADRLLVALGETVFPGTTNYAHFQIHDYARLTVIGVVIACLAWPVVARISSSPQWLFVRLAVVVTIVLLIPDGYIWFVQGQSARAVFVLVWMHLAIALVTYNALVHIAPVSRATGRAVHQRR